MEQPDFTYKRKPAFISFLLVYLFCFGIAYLLIKESSYISGKIAGKLLSRLNIPRSNIVWNIPYGIVISVPFILIGIQKFLWNIMSSYEMTSTELRLITGSLSRRTRFFDLSDFYDISFKQNLLETPFSIGCIILKSRHKNRLLIIKGVFNVKAVVKELRPGLVSFGKY